MSETNHPWCRDPVAQAAVRAAEDDAAQWRRLEVGEVIESSDEYLIDGVWRFVPSLYVGDSIGKGYWPMRRRRVPLPDHRDLPEAVAELRERVGRLEALAEAWRQRCEQEADDGSVTPPHEAEPVSRAGVNASVDLVAERDAAIRERDEARARVAEYEKIRQWDIEKIEDGCIRVCFGDHHRAADCEWEYFIPASREACSDPGESVRVVEEATIGSGDVYRDVGCGTTGDEIVRLTAERDAARAEEERLRARVAELERAYSAECDARAQAHRELSELSDAIRERESGEERDNSYAAQCREAAEARDRADRFRWARGCRK